MIRCVLCKWAIDFLSLKASNVLCKRVCIQRIYFRGLLSVVSVIRYCLYLFYSTLPKHQSRRKLQVLECMKCLIFLTNELVKKPGRLNQVVVILSCHTCRKLLFFTQNLAWEAILTGAQLDKEMSV